MDIVAIALIGGSIHHVVFQYPNQASLFSTLSGVALSNGLIFCYEIYFKAHLQLFRHMAALFIFNIVYITSAFIFKTLYNVYFRHHGIPGQFWYCTTDWAFWRQVQVGQPYELIANFHRQSGDAVRIQPNHICFNTIEAFEDIYGHHTKALKGDFYAMLGGKSGMPTSIFTELDKGRHGFLRRVMNPSFGPNPLKAFEKTMETHYERFIWGIRQKASQNDGVVEINSWFHNLAFDIAGSLTLGVEFGSLLSGEQHFFMKRMHRNLIFLNLVATITWVSPLLRPLPLPEWITGPRGKLKKFTEDAVSTALQAEKADQSRNILSTLLRAKDPETGVGLQFGDLVMNSQTLLCGASDTTAIGLTFTLYSVLANPSYWKRLCDEIRTKFAAAEEITGRSTEVLPFLGAVIHEGLRLYPPVTTLHPRITPHEGMIIDGHFIHGNTEVSCSNWTMVHDSRYFSNPYSFIPERWIETERGSETCTKAAWVPFLPGRWGCIGKPLALLEMRIALARLVWHYDLSLVEDEPPAYLHRSLAAGPLEVHMKERHISRTNMD